MVWFATVQEVLQADWQETLNLSVWARLRTFLKITLILFIIKPPCLGFHLSIIPSRALCPLGYYYLKKSSGDVPPSVDLKNLCWCLYR